jgi:hypothetical protein
LNFLTKIKKKGILKINKTNFFRIWKTSLQKSIKFKTLTILFYFYFLFDDEPLQTVFYKFVKVKKLESISNFRLIFFYFEKAFAFFYFLFVFLFCLFGIQKKKQIKENKASKNSKILKKRLQVKIQKKFFKNYLRFLKINFELYFFG